MNKEMFKYLLFKDFEEVKMNYKEYCEKRLSENCLPISEIEFETGMSMYELRDFWKQKNGGI